MDVFVYLLIESSLTQECFYFYSKLKYPIYTHKEEHIHSFKRLPETWKGEISKRVRLKWRNSSKKMNESETKIRKLDRNEASSG